MELDIKGMLQEILREEIGKALNGMTKPAVLSAVPNNPPVAVENAAILKETVADIIEARKMGSRGHLNRALAEAIIADIDAGVKMPRLQKKYNVSICTLRRIAGRLGVYEDLLKPYDTRTGSSAEKSTNILRCFTRTHKITELADARRILEEVQTGTSCNDVCQRYKISPATLGRILSGADRYAVLHEEAEARRNDS